MEKKKDWTGNSNSVYKSMGASNHTEEERESNDYYATDPMAGEMLLNLEAFSPNIWECSCGAGHLSEVFSKVGYKVKSTDLIDRGYGEGGVDFLKSTEPFNGDIVTNPPYSLAQEFVEHALELIPEGNKVAMFLKLQFLEGKKRSRLFKKYRPKTVYVSCSRLVCAKNGDFEEAKKIGGSAVAYCWYVWEKGYSGFTQLKWFN